VDAPAAISPADLEFFESRVRPVLVENCYECHSSQADRVRGGLLLDTREDLLFGGATGPAIVPGDPEASLLIQGVLQTDPDFSMPDNGTRLTDREIADLTEWIRRGAPDPRGNAAPGSAPAYGGVGRRHWSFLPPQEAPPPVVADSVWVQSPIDAFILDRLETAGLTPNPAADQRTLLRRVSFDLTGLPPTEAEMEAFLADESPDAFAEVVDRLLASPQFGERWGRHWLDVARYADTKGDPAQRDDARLSHAWTYRDYVIDAFNSDKPYDQFIEEQLAADLLIAERQRRNPGDVTEEERHSLAALGFLTLGNTFDGNRHDVINDQIDVTTKGFLGLTVSCARCHDHKFDPIPTADYYSLYGIFANTTQPAADRAKPLLDPVPDSPELREYLAQVDTLTEQQQALDAELQSLRRAAANAARAGGRAGRAGRAGQVGRGAAPDPAARPLIDPQQRQQILRQQTQLGRAFADLESSPGAPARVNILNDVPIPRNYPILLRGEAQNVGSIVPRRFLEILSDEDRPEYRGGSGRLQLARDIASPENPLTARVLVNRVWQHLFGVGFVPTPDDLGNMSAPPTHPELLDYLARQFVEDGWSVKSLIREIVLSSTYQVSADADSAKAAIDPDNELHWRANLRRLDFESVHDSLLAIAGTLDLTMGGPSVPIGSSDFATRRAVYAFIDRANPAEILTQFDFPNPSVVTGRRHETIVPQQSLFLMNSPLVIETARSLTRRPEFLELDSDVDRVRSLYEAIYQRPPTDEEGAIALAYVEANPDGTGVETPEATRASRIAGLGALQQARQAERAQRGVATGRGQVQVEPAAAAFTSRDPLDAWTKLAHSLFQTNEAMFYD